METTPEDAEFIRMARIVEKAQSTEFWPVFEKFMQDYHRAHSQSAAVCKEAVPMAAAVGRSNAALDIFDQLSQLPAQSAELQKRLAAEAAHKPKPSRTHGRGQSSDL